MAGDCSASPARNEPGRTEGPPREHGLAIRLRVNHRLAAGAALADVMRHAASNDSFFLRHARPEWFPRSLFPALCRKMRSRPSQTPRICI
jgi:hypothetical protein